MSHTSRAVTNLRHTPELDLFLDRVGARLRAARIAQRQTLQDVATKAEILEGELSKLERGQAHLGIDRLRRLAAALGIPMARFFDDETEPLPAAMPPRPLDPNYLVDPDERKLIEHYRELMGKEQRIIMLLATEMRTLRDRRYEPVAQRRKRNWSRPAKNPDPLAPTQTPANGKWLNEHAEEYHGQWVALRYGKLLEADPQRHVLVSRLVGQEGVLLVSLLDLKNPRFERFPPKPELPPASAGDYSDQG